MHIEQKSPNDTPGTGGGKKAAGTHTGTANPQDLQLCLRSLSCLAEIHAHGHALTINLTFIIFSQGIPFCGKTNQNTSPLVCFPSRALGRHGMLPWHASGAQVSARPVLQGLMEDLNPTATFPQTAIHSNHVYVGMCKTKQLST